MSLDAEQRLWVVVGPTASGKTELALRLAEQIDGEVVSADSVQVYRYFDIGSGKPSQAELARAPHHLIDCCDPHESLDAARWAELAEASLQEIKNRGKRPIVCGGSFLFVRALIYGLAPAPPADPELRERHRAVAEVHGRQALHEELERVDPARAAELNPNDFVRVSRALEIFELSGVPMSQWQAGHGFREVRYPARLIGVAREREEQDALIAARIAKMFAAGWLEEVATLLERGYADTRPMGSVGYRQLAELLRESRVEELRGSPRLEETREAIYRATRVFARRQRTWLREERVEWLAPDTLPS
ncbi:MAG: tRNA (adenosine(37)-N6)-dimethylallyltransferase MiaA [Polyangiaceae bacterium]